MNNPETITALAVAPTDLSADLDWNRSNKVAELCKSIVEATAIQIDGKRYIPIEGWQSIAAAWGCTPGTDEPHRTEDGYRVRAILRRDSDGAVLSTAYGFVGDDEPRWAKRPRQANESMAQTRAMSRVCANKFRFIPVLMKIENLATTPYEEMPGVDDEPRAVRDPQPVREAQPLPKRPVTKKEENANSSNLEHFTAIVDSSKKGQTKDGKPYLQCFAGGRSLYAFDIRVMDALEQAQGKEITAMVRAGKRPGSYIIEDFHYALS